MKTWVLAILIAFTSLASAGEVLIQGGIKGFEGKVLSANRIEDYISFQKEKISEQRIQNGEFQLRFNLEETTQIILKIENKETSLFAEPGGIYRIGLSFDEKINQGRSFDPILSIQFMLPEANEVNSLIKKFNTAYQDFFAKYYPKFVINAAGKEIDEFISKLEKDPSYKQNAFVANYVTYALANLKDINKEDPEKLFESYLKGKPVLSTNKEYMNFFTQLYQGDFEQFSLGKKGKATLEALVIKKDLDLAKKELKAAMGFEQDELVELYLLYSLFDVFHIKRINQKRSLEILSEIEKNSLYPNNKKLAQNLIEQLSIYTKSIPAPDFTLLDLKGEPRSLSDFKGKPIYLSFWSSQSIPSLREMQIIKRLVNEYGEQVHFISINLDEKKEMAEKSAKQYNFDWTLLLGGQDFALREKYNIRTVPSYFFLDEKGKIEQAFELGPLEMDRKLFERYP